MKLTEAEIITALKDLEPFIKKIVDFWYPRIAHCQNVQGHEDFMNIARLGAWEALQRYDTQFLASISSYCFPRIKGSIIDHKRYISRFVKGESFRFTSDEVIESNSTSEQSVYISQQTDQLENPHLDSFLVDMEEELEARLDPPLIQMILEEAGLNETERICLSFWLFEDLTLKVIGEMLDISESAVSLQTKKARKKVKRFLLNYLW